MRGMADDEWDDVIATNLTSCFICCRAVANIMRKAKYGRIINMASISGLIGNAGQANYSASKAGMIGLTRTLSKELANREELEARVAEVRERFADGDIPCPPFWGGFRVRPTRIEFWQGRQSRLHDRIVYELRGGMWFTIRLAP